MRLDEERRAAQTDAGRLYIGNLNTVEFDLNLPARGGCGSEITWRSENPSLLSDGGRVARPAWGQGDREVTLRAEIRNGGAVERRSFRVHILQMKDRKRIVKILPVCLTAAVNAPVCLPAAVVAEREDGTASALPVVWRDGSERRFSAPGIYRTEGAAEGTALPAWAAVEIREAAAPEENLPRPAVRMLIHARLDGGGPFWAAQERNLAYLRTVDDDQMLYNFRFAAGLDTKGAPEMNGWDAPDSQIRGHTTGHYLSALALCYEATGEAEIARKAAYLVAALRACQAKFSATEGVHRGFLSGYSERQFDQLEQGVRYPEIWAPYYTLHKIFAGLLDCHRAFASETALQICRDLGLWVYERLSRLTRARRAAMWATYIAGEFGGMNEVLARLYQLTGEARYLAAARMFDNDKLLYPMLRNVDTLGGMHANQHIPQIIGAVRMYEASGEPRYLRAAENFWNFVTRDHIYAIGGTGEGEMFHRPRRIGALLTDRTAESCASYNMLKLTAELFRYHPEAGYMDYYERTMVNHILSSGEQRPTGASTYFMPLGPGFVKRYEDDSENSCCHGTGLENHFKYARAAYSCAERELLVNLYLNSSVRWGGIALEQRAREESDRVRTALTVSGEGGFRLRIRRPYWCAGEPVCRVNGELVRPREEDGYLAFARRWKTGDTVACAFPCALRLEPAPDCPDRAALCWGPYVLAALSARREFLRLSDTGNRPLRERLVPGGAPGEFLLRPEGTRFVPLCRVRDEPYQVYVLR